MSSKVNPIPKDQPQVIPYLIVRSGPDAIEFYRNAFGATELMRMADPSGKVGHAELEIGRGRIMLSDEYPEMGGVSPETIGGSPVMIHLYVEDVDTTFGQAVAAGAKVLRPVENEFYGDRAGKLADPFGHIWWVASHVEDVEPEDLQKRSAALFGMS